MQLTGMAEPLTAISSCLSAPAVSPVLALTLVSPFAKLIQLANPTGNCSLFIGLVLCWVSCSQLSKGSGSARASTREGTRGVVTRGEQGEKREMTSFYRAGRGVQLYHTALLEVDFAVRLTAYQRRLWVTHFFQN